MGMFHQPGCVFFPMRNVEDWEAHTAYTHGLHKEFRAKGVGCP